METSTAPMTDVIVAEKVPKSVTSSIEPLSWLGSVRDDWHGHPGFEVGWFRACIWRQCPGETMSI